MISRPMHGTPYIPYRGTRTSDAPITPLPYQSTLGPHGGYPAPIIRTKSFAFGPRLLPPVNKIVGPPRLYG
jgi:hypothetical protein